MSLLKVGEVAEKVGLTVRALHHYDKIGLMSPQHRSETGCRLYSLEDLMQLQKIKSFQQLGFSLKAIASLLESSEESLANILNQHLQSLTSQLEQQRMLIQRLRQLVDVLQQDGDPSVELLLDTLKVTVMFEKYYSSEQIEQLAARRKEISDDTLNAAQQEWQEIFEQFRTLYENKALASCKEAQALAKRSLELIDMFTGGDPGIRQSLDKMYDTEGGEKILSHSDMNVDKALFAYFSEAMALAKDTR